MHQEVESANNLTTKRYNVFLIQIDKIDFNLDEIIYPTYFYNLRKNKAKAMKILRARIYEVERKKKDMVRSEARKGQVGTGDRSEKIRTYNYPQSRISDHRINFTSYNLEEFVNEGKLDEVIEGLIADDNMKKLAKLLKEQL